MGVFQYGLFDSGRLGRAFFEPTIARGAARDAGEILPVALKLRERVPYETEPLFPIQAPKLSGALC
jgi:hypothetical protein